MGRSEVRNILQSIDDEPGLFDFEAAVFTIANVGLQGLDPEAHLVIEEKIDLVWKQVPVIHEFSESIYGGERESVSNTIERWSGRVAERWNGEAAGLCEVRHL
jgi:hypothetical protein